MKNRLYQGLLIGSFLLFSWIGFMAVHEFGRIAVAWLSGGAVARVVLHPLQISWSAFSPNPHPQLVAWGGPLVGSMLPLAVFGIARAMRAPGLYLVRFFAGFCLIANGIYMLIDVFDRSGDGATLLQHGASAWQIILFGLGATPVGFWMWHGLGHHFGLGGARGKVSPAAAIVSLCLLVATVVAELVLYEP